MGDFAHGCMQVALTFGREHAHLLIRTGPLVAPCTYARTRPLARSRARAVHTLTRSAVEDACTSDALTLMLVCSSARLLIRSHDRIHSLIRSTIRTASSSTCVLVLCSFTHLLVRLHAWPLTCSSARLLVAPYTYARTRVRSHARAAHTLMSAWPSTHACSSHARTARL